MRHTHRQAMIERARDKHRQTVRDWKRDGQCGPQRQVPRETQWEDKERQTQTVGEWDGDTVTKRATGGGAKTDGVCPTKKDSSIFFFFSICFFNSGCVHKHVSLGRKSNTIRSRKRHLHVFTYVQYDPVHHIVYILHCIVPFVWSATYSFITRKYHHHAYCIYTTLAHAHTSTRIILAHAHRDTHTNKCTSTWDIRTQACTQQKHTRAHTWPQTHAHTHSSTQNTHTH